MDDLYDLSYDEEPYQSDEDSNYSSDNELSDYDEDSLVQDTLVPSIKTCFPVRWMTIQLDSLNFDVSNTGKIKNSCGYISEGIHLHGTPYSFFQIEYEKDRFKNYYMHELVWQAFNGMPPDGWIVRHKSEYTKTSRKIYNNSLSNIIIVPNTILPLAIERGEYIM